MTSNRPEPQHPRRRHMSSEDEPTNKEREYLEVIYYLATRGEPVIAARLARWMRVQPPTVTNILERLKRKQFINRDERGEITLTDEGFKQAEAMVRRHRILERFLVDVMKMPWHIIHEEAVRLEHNLSPTMEAQIEALVGHSTTCPHGNPIPGLGLPYPGSISLEHAEVGKPFTIMRIAEEAEEDTDLVRFLQTNSLVPGSQFTVSDASSAYGVTLQRGPQLITVTPEMAGLLWGEVG